MDKSVNHKVLHDTFSVVGNIVSCKIAIDSNGRSKGYGFVQFENEESAQKAIEKLNGMLLNDKNLYVGSFIPKQERDNVVDKSKFNNVFVKNLSESTTEEDMKRIFGEFGTTTSVIIMRHEDGKSKCFGFVNFEKADDAARAVQALNGRKFDDKEWYVSKAQKKSERELELKLQFEQNMTEVPDKYQAAANLFIKNLDDSINDDKLKELFTPFGTVTSCKVCEFFLPLHYFLYSLLIVPFFTWKVMRDPNGMSRGSGFVAFSTIEEASRAVSCSVIIISTITSTSTIIIIMIKKTYGIFLFIGNGIII